MCVCEVRQKCSLREICAMFATSCDAARAEYSSSNVYIELRYMYYIFKCRFRLNDRGHGRVSPSSSADPQTFSAPPNWMCRENDALAKHRAQSSRRPETVCLCRLLFASSEVFVCVCGLISPLHFVIAHAAEKCIHTI